MKRSPSITVLFLAAAILLAGCSRRAGQPNVLLITLDATRADRLGCYGYAGAVTPNLDRLAREGTRFAAASTVAPITLPAHTTLLTGLHPPEHGLHINGQGCLPADVPTVAEAFKQAGYSTAAFVAFQALSSEYGLAKGFDLYDEPPKDASEDPLLFVPLQADDAPCLYRKADAMADRVLAWLERGGRRPWFVWVHFYDPHHPLHWNRKQVGEGFTDPYDAEVAFMDQQIGRLLAWVDKKGPASRTLVMAVADHGESLGDHGEPAHAFLLYEPTLHLPWLLRQPGRVPAGAVLDGSVSLVQAAPTLLDLAGVRPHAPLAAEWSRAAWADGPEATPAASRRDSLAGAVDRSSVGDFACYSETDQPYASYKWSPLRALRKGRWKFIRAPADELYDVAADPHEATNRLASETAQVQALTRALAEREDLMPQRKAKDVYQDQASWRRLASLGYLSGSRAEARDPKNDRLLPNPNALIRCTALSARIRNELRAGAADEELLKAANSLVEQAPMTAQFRMDLAEVLASRGDLPGAVRAAEEALRLEAERSDIKANLGVFYAKSGETLKALALFREVFRQTPDYARARQNYFQALQDAIQKSAAARAFDEAGRLLDEAAAADTQNPAWELRRAWVLNEAGRRDEAVSHLRALLEKNPGFAPARQLLGKLEK